MQFLNLRLGGDRNKKPCADHTGRRFASVSEMARAWGLSPVLYHNRRRRKWSLERALTVPVGARYGGCHDHLGRWFPSQKAMCDHWGVDGNVFDVRRRRKWSIERALTTPYHEPFRPVVDPETGMKYRSAAAYARAVGVLGATMQSRMRGIRAGRLSPEFLPYDGCLRCTPSRDHLGKDYPSLTAMAAAYGLTVHLLSRRLVLGWPLERALTLPVGQRRGRKRKEAAHVC